jgi:hypothetical protein
MRRVSLVDFPLQVGIKARQHRESLLREFAIIAAGGGDRADVPKRLLEIAKLHEDRYAGLNPEADERIDTAIKARSGFITSASRATRSMSRPCCEKSTNTAATARCSRFSPPTRCAPSGRGC